jgi:hypothetical protein
MKTTLIKTNNHYYLEQIPSKGISGAVFEMMMGSTDGEGYYKLSKQNCDEIFGVVDVEKLASEVYEDDWDDKGRNIGRTLQYAFEEGFNKAMELNKDKQFTLEDVRMGIAYGEKHRDMDAGKVPYQTFVEFIPSLKQPTEIEVEIEMNAIPADRAPNGWDIFPKLDSEGCLILKKIEQ